MIRFMLFAMALAVAFSSRASGDAATITSNPSPAVSSMPVTITISIPGKDYGNDVYVYSWITPGTTEYRAALWDNTNTSAFKMTRSGNAYTYTITDLCSFYKKVVKQNGSDKLAENLTSEVLSTVTSLNFIAKSSTGSQTADLSIELTKPKYSGGVGSEADPWQIGNVSDLLALAGNSDHWGAECHFRLTADIADVTLTAPIGNSTTPFAGTFEGNGHKITGFRIDNGTWGEPTGLFGCVNGGTISRLGVQANSVRGTVHTGILVGVLQAGAVDQCYTSGTVSATSICAGGLVGFNDEGGQISDSYSTASVKTSSYAAGGLAGKNSGTITRCLASGSVEAFDYVAGLVGANYGSVANSVAVNEQITSDNQTNYGARFGGNNNSENNSTGNHAWGRIPAGHGEWTNYGDHATLETAYNLYHEDSFRKLSGWDFDTVWRWQTPVARAAAQEGPVLQVHDNSQPVIFPAALYDAVTGIEGISGEETSVAVGPNPTSGPVTVTASEGIGMCAVYSVSGGQVASACGDGSAEVTLNLSHCTPGLYLLTVATPSCTRTFKLIKK